MALRVGKVDENWNLEGYCGRSSWLSSTQSWRRCCGDSFSSHKQGLPWSVGLVSSLAKSNCDCRVANHVDLRSWKCSKICQLRKRIDQAAPAELSPVDTSGESCPWKATRSSQIDSKFADCHIGSRDWHYWKFGKKSGKHRWRIRLDQPVALLFHGADSIGWRSHDHYQARILQRIFRKHGQIGHHTSDWSLL